MAARYEETSARIEYPGEVRLNLAALAETLSLKLRNRGARFNVIATTRDDELQFISNEMIVTLRRCATDSRRVRIKAASLIGAAHPRNMTNLRFAACTTLVRALLPYLPAERVVWKHKGRTYVTAEGEKLEIAPCKVRPAMAALPARTERLPVLAPPEGEDAIRHRFDMMQDMEEHSLRDLRRHLCAPAAPEETVASAGSTCDKISLYALNATVMVVSAPIGAGLMAYNLLSGGSINTTARTLGITGTVAGLSTLAASPALAQMTAPVSTGAIGSALQALAPIFASLF